MSSSRDRDRRPTSSYTGPMSDLKRTSRMSPRIFEHCSSCMGKVGKGAEGVGGDGTEFRRKEVGEKTENDVEEETEKVQE